MAMTPLLRILTNIFVFLLPVIAAWVEHSASAVLIMLTLLGIWTWFRHKQEIKFIRAEKAVMIAFSAFFALSVLSIPVHSILLENYKPDYKLGHEIRMLTFIPIYFLFLHEGIKSETFWYGICAGAIINGIYAGVSVYTLEPGIRIIGAYNPIVFGDTCMVLAFMSLAGLNFFEKKHRLLLLLPIAAFILGLTGVYLSGSRGAFLAWPMMFLLFLVHLGNRPRAWRIRTALVIVVIAAALGGGLLTESSMNKRIQSGIDTAVASLTKEKENIIIDAADPSTALRLKMWGEAMEIIRTHPWMGVGDEGFERILKEKAKSDPSISPIKEFSTPHNMYLTCMTAYGIFGLATLMGIFLVPLIVLIRWIRKSGTGRDYAYAGVMLIIAYMQFALTESLFGRTVPITIYLVYTAATMALCRRSEFEIQPAP